MVQQLVWGPECGEASQARVLQQRSASAGGDGAHQPPFPVILSQTAQRAQAGGEPGSLLKSIGHGEKEELRMERRLLVCV